MPTVDTIRRLRIVATSEGLDEVRNKLEQVADGQEAIARTSERASKGQLSVERALDSVRKKYDAAYRAQQEQARVMAVLDRAYQQNRVSLMQREQLMEQVRQKTEGSTSAAQRMAAVNENVARSYTRMGVALNALSPLLDRVGVSGTVGLMGGGAFAGIAAGAAAIAGTSALIAKAGDEWSVYANRLKTAGESTDQLSQRTKDLADLSIRARTDMGSVVDLYAGLRTSTQDLGRSQSDTMRVVETITKAFQLNGTSAQAAAGSIQQLGQAFASGTLRGDELNSVMEGSPPLARLIAQEFGTTVGELRRLGELGAISADRVFNALLKGSTSIDEAFSKTTSSLAQSSTNALTSFSQLGAEIDRILGLSARLVNAFDAVGASVRGLAGNVAAFGDQREVQRIQSALEAIRVYEAQIKELSGRKDFASQQDLKAATEQLQRYREEFERLTQQRVQGMVPLPDPIQLNSEGLVTTGRTIREVEKATTDLATAEKALALESMSPLARATAEANEAHEKRLKLYQELLKSGAEVARINDLIARSEKVRAGAIAEAGETRKTADDRRMVLEAYRKAVPEQARRNELEESIGRLQGLSADDLREMHLTASQVATAIERLKSELLTLQSPLQRMTQDADLAIRAIQAHSFEEKASVEAERARMEVLRSSRTELEAATAAEIERNRMMAQAQREVMDNLQSARRNAEMVGLNPLQRQQRQIEQNYQEKRLQAPVELHGLLNEAEALEKWAATQEAMRGPLEDANRALSEQIAAARLQAESFGRSTAEIEAAAEAQRLFNEYMRAGVEISPLLAQNIQAYAERAGQLKAAQEQIQAQQESYRQINDMGKDALKGFLSDLKQGKSAGEAFLNVLERILDRMLDMMLDSLFDPKSQGGFNIFSMLFGGSQQRINLPSMTQTAFPFGTLAAPGSAPPMIPPPQPISTNIAGSLVPAFRQASETMTETFSKGVAQTFTKVTDGLRYQVETYLRAEAEARGMDGDIIARGIKQESGFNPAAYNPEGSYGVMQLYTKGGLGNVAMSKGISLAPSNWREQVDFSLDYMQKNGFKPWNGFRDIGIRDPFAAHKAFNARALTGSAGSDRIGGGMGLDDLSSQVDQATGSFENLTPNLDQFGSGFENITQAMQQGVPQLQQSFTQVPSMIGKGGEGVGDALQNTAGVIGQGSQGIGGALNQLGQALSGIGGGGGGGGFGGLGGLLSGLGGGGGWGGWMNNMDSWTLPSDFSMSFFHEGGRVGGGGGRRASMTVGDLIGLMSAPRFHNGSNGRLRSDERYAVVQTDEEILSRRQAAEYRKGKSGSNGMQVVQPVVNVINPPSEPETRTNPDGSVDVIFEQMEGRMAERARRGRGPLVKAIGSRREGNALIG